MIDEKYYTKKQVKLSFLGKVMFYSGAGVPYLDYQEWKMYFRFWHPLAWLYIILYISLDVISEIQVTIEEIKEEFFPEKQKRQYNYYNAK